MLNDEFGQWIDHDGNGRPVPAGTVVEVEGRCITGLVKRHIGMAGACAGSSWDWRSFSLEQPWMVIRYRVRRPRAMVVIDSLLAKISAERETS